MTERPQPPASYLAPAAPAAPAGVDGPWGPLADWGSRVGASVIDGLLQLVGVVPYVIGLVLLVSGAPSGNRFDPETSTFVPESADRGLVVTGVALVVLGLLLMVGITLWNRTFRQGRTGQSLGKRTLGIRLVDEHTGRPIGAGMSFLRELCHMLDGMAYVGYLWPLWDGKRQTFADKVIGTVVVRVPRP